MNWIPNVVRLGLLLLEVIRGRQGPQLPESNVIDLRKSRDLRPDDSDAAQRHAKRRGGAK